MKFAAGIVGLTAVAVTTVIFVPPLLQQFKPQNPLPSVSSEPVTATELVDMEPLPVESQPVSPEPDPATATAAIPESPQLDPEVRELLERVTQFLEQNHGANLYLDERLADLEDALEPLTQLGGYIMALDTRIALLEESVSSLTKQNPDFTTTTMNETPEPVPPTGPPFRLISIDRWQQKWNAVLEFDGKLKMIEPPARVAGWQLLSIDPNRRTAVFRDSGGNEMELTAG